MVTSKSSQAFRNFALYIRKLRPKMIPRLTLRHYVLLVMGVLIPGLALGGTVCLESPFGAQKLSAWFSDENTEWQVVTGFITGVYTRGTNADDLQVIDSLLLAGYSRSDPESQEFKVSEENQVAKCPANMWISSIRTSGAYSDNIHFKCRGAKYQTAPLKSANCYFTRFINGPSTTAIGCPPISAVTGIRCEGSFCSAMAFECCSFMK